MKGPTPGHLLHYVTRSLRLRRYLRDPGDGRLQPQIPARLKDNLPELLAAARQRFPGGPPATVFQHEKIVWKSGMPRNTLRTCSFLCLPVLGKCLSFHFMLLCHGRGRECPALHHLGTFSFFHSVSAVRLLPTSAR